MYQVVAGLSLQGAVRGENSYDVAAKLLQHWLDASGTPIELHPDSMLNEVPKFKTDVKKYLTDFASGKDRFDSGWQKSRAVETDGTSSVGWFYALITSNGK
ncbi:hypothetical protein [Kitasatospora sp. A2-31]|uniref:hypothetical protein n=1 Tax=Kitasatospora sp. A2-31 TaxID=2916414 RepID=UPI001EEEEA51|nr:hypothetical protein [Kitasatospora sp. A2-31]MCG6499640.1 hypothetical protein [Kitasatospora sp. A2-31]